MYQTVTVFNKKRNPTTKYDEFKRTVLQAHWESAHGIKLGEINIKSDDDIVVVFPVQEGFVLPSAYALLEDVSNKWTLGKGDYIVKGNVPDISSFADLVGYDEKMVVDSYEVNDQSFIKRLHNYTATGK